MSRIDAKTLGRVVRTRDAGFTLPIVLSVLVMLGVMGVAALQASRDEMLSALAVSKSNQAFYAAEAGLHSALENWDQAAMNTLLADPGDSLVTSWTTIENRCGFRLVYRRIDGGDTILAGARLYSIESTGRTPGLDGAMQRIGGLVKEGVAIAHAIAFQGNLEFSSNVSITGECGDIHSNGDIALNGNATLGGTVESAGTVVINGNPVDTLGNPITGISGADKRPIPRIYADDFCGEADFVFNSSGVGLRVSTSESFDFAPGGGMWGWKWDSGKNIYKSDSDHVEQGVYCVDGNMEIANNFGVPGSPWEVTFLVEGSVQISGNPYLKPAHSKDIVIIAEGDLKLNGNPAGGNENFNGLLYGGAQCEVSGTPRIHGQLICKNSANPPGSEAWVDENKISGDAIIVHTCGGIMEEVIDPVPIVRMWTHVW